MSGFWSPRAVRSRQVRRCDEGRCEIPPGEPHLYIAAIEEGEFYTARLCTVCSNLRHAIWSAFDLGSDEGPTFGDARGWLAEECDVADADAWLATYEADKARRVADAAAQARQIDLDTAATIGWPGEIPGHG